MTDRGQNATLTAPQVVYICTTSGRVLEEKRSMGGTSFLHIHVGL